MNEVSYLIAFASGFLYFFSPCVLPLVPSFLSFISGLSFKEMKEDPKSARKKVLLSSCIFLIGFSVVFITLGLTASAIGSYVIKFKFPIQKIGGGIIISLGIYLLFQSKFKALSGNISFLSRIKPMGTIGILLVGSAFAFSWTACATPILSAILIYASVEATLRKGFALLCSFSFGLGLPFIISAYSLSIFLTTFERVKRHLRYFEIFVAMLLIIFGLYIFMK